ncbi:trypco2 family protein [Nannocystaceae bacterium ST9]
MSNEDLDQNIPLSEMIESLRQELAVAIEAGKGKPIRFGVSKVELQLEVAVSRKTTGGGGLKFWVMTAKGEHAVDKLTKHTFKLTLDPKLAHGGAVEVADEVDGRPDFG